MVKEEKLALQTAGLSQLPAHLGNHCLLSLSKLLSVSVAKPAGAAGRRSPDSPPTGKKHPKRTHQKTTPGSSPGTPVSDRRHDSNTKCVSKTSQPTPSA